MKVLIGLPTKGDMPIETVSSLMAMEIDCEAGTRIMQGSLIDDSRETIANEAIENGFDYIMWIDSDMVFETDAVQKLIDDNLDCVTGIAFKRVPPYFPCVYELKEGSYLSMIDYPEDSIFEIDASGCAFQLVKVEWLKKIKEKFGKIYLREYPFGEDISFSKRFKQVGGKMYCDSRVKIGHVGNVVVTENTFKRCKESIKR